MEDHVWRTRMKTNEKDKRCLKKIEFDEMEHESLTEEFLALNDIPKPKMKPGVKSIEQLYCNWMQGRKEIQTYSWRWVIIQVMSPFLFDRFTWGVRKTFDVASKFCCFSSNGTQFANYQAFVRIKSQDVLGLDRGTWSNAYMFWLVLDVFKPYVVIEDGARPSVNDKHIFPLLYQMMLIKKECFDQGGSKNEIKKKLSKKKYLLALAQDILDANPCLEKIVGADAQVLNNLTGSSVERADRVVCLLLAITTVCEKSVTIIRDVGLGDRDVESEVHLMQKESEEYKNLKEYGNEAFRKKKYKDAIDLYSLAIKRFPWQPKLYSNRCRCLIEEKNERAAKLDGLCAVVLLPDWTRGYVRLTEALVLDGMFELAFNLIAVMEEVCWEESAEWEAQRARLYKHRDQGLCGNEQWDRVAARNHFKQKLAQNAKELIEQTDNKEKASWSGSEFATDFFLEFQGSILPDRKPKFKKPKPKDLVNNKSTTGATAKPVRLTADQSASSENVSRSASAESLNSSKKKADSSSSSSDKASTSDMKSWSEMEEEAIAKTKEALARGSRCLVSDIPDYVTAISCFNIALKNVDEFFTGGRGDASGAKFKKAFDVDTCAIIRYALGAALLGDDEGEGSCSADDKRDFTRAIDLWLEQRDRHGFPHPMFHYSLARAYFKLNRFSDASEQLNKAKNISLTRKNFKEDLTWPESESTIFESSKKNLLQVINDLEYRIKHPPKPLAICRYSECSSLFLTPKIYDTDDPFEGYIEISCCWQCVVQFHHKCWSKLRADLSLKDKEFLSRECFTNGCRGFIVEINKYDHEKKNSFNGKMFQKSIEIKMEVERQNSLIDVMLGKSREKKRMSKSARNLEICMRRISEKKAKKNQNKPSEIDIEDRIKPSSPPSPSTKELVLDDRDVTGAELYSKQDKPEFNYYKTPSKSKRPPQSSRLEFNLNHISQQDRSIAEFNQRRFQSIQIDLCDEEVDHLFTFNQAYMELLERTGPISRYEAIFDETYANLSEEVKSFVAVKYGSPLDLIQLLDMFVVKETYVGLKSQGDRIDELISITQNENDEEEKDISLDYDYINQDDNNSSSEEEYKKLIKLKEADNGNALEFFTSISAEATKNGLERKDDPPITEILRTPFKQSQRFDVTSSHTEKAADLGIDGNKIAENLNNLTLEQRDDDDEEEEVTATPFFAMNCDLKTQENNKRLEMEKKQLRKENNELRKVNREINDFRLQAIDEFFALQEEVKAMESLLEEKKKELEKLKKQSVEDEKVKNELKDQIEKAEAAAVKLNEQHNHQQIQMEKRVRLAEEKLASEVKRGDKLREEMGKMTSITDALTLDSRAKDQEINAWKQLHKRDYLHALGLAKTMNASEFDHRIETGRQLGDVINEQFMRHDPRFVAECVKDVRVLVEDLCAKKKAKMNEYEARHKEVAESEVIPSLDEAILTHQPVSKPDFFTPFNRFQDMMIKRIEGKTRNSNSSSETTSSSTAAVKTCDSAVQCQLTAPATANNTVQQKRDVKENADEQHVREFHALESTTEDSDLHKIILELRTRFPRLSVKKLTVAVWNARRQYPLEKINRNLFINISTGLIQKGNYSDTLFDVISAAKENNSENLNDCDEICNLCLEDLNLQSRLSLPCQHWYHESCMEKWSGRHKTCPVCPQRIMM